MSKTFRLKQRVFASVFVRVAFCLSLVAVPTYGTDITRDAATRDVGKLLEPITNKHKAPGMAAAVVSGERLLGTGVCGVRKSGSPQRIGPGDLFHIGSCTKSMTATLCAMLAEEGKLSWSTTLAEAFPELGEKIDLGFRGVTLRQLLSNRGGMPDDKLRGDLWGKFRSDHRSVVDARQLLLEGIVAAPPSVRPGEDYLYSNAGFAIAGHIAERTAGMAWEELIRKRLFDPLGMRSAGFGAPGTPNKVDQPCGHTADGKPLEPGPNADNPPPLGPAGTVHLSIEDWAKYAAFHLRAGKGEPKLLRGESFQTLHQPAVAVDGDGYALGWVTTRRDWGKGPVLTHAGTNTYWFACIWLAPKRDFAVVVTCNQGGDAGAKACDEAAGKLIGEFLR